MAPDPLPPTLTELRRAILAGDILPRNALAQQRDALKQDAYWHAVTHVFPDGPPAPLSCPLAGVGLAHKDIFTMQGRPPRCGASAAPDICGGDSPVVRRLEQAGGTTLAALSLAEYAAGVTGENPNLPMPVNPVDEGAAVGGSSSGSAVAVAAGLCYGSLGTDTAGSVRIPAATCGVLGLLPTRNVLPLSGCQPLAPDLDTVGILARSALDAAQIFASCLTDPLRKQLMPRLRPTDGSTPVREWAAVHDSLALKASPRIGLVLEHPDPRHTPSADQAQALRRFAELDATAKEVVLPQLKELARNASVLLHTEAASTHYAALRRPGSPISSITRGLALPGAAIPAVWYQQCLRGRQAHLQDFCDAYLNDHDIILTPVLPQGVPDWAKVHTRSPSFEPRSLLALFSWTAFVNYLGLPAVVFPVDTDRRGRPVCVQAIARPHAEALLLEFAYRFERDRHGLAGFVPHPCAMIAPSSITS